MVKAINKVKDTLDGEEEVAKVAPIPEPEPKPTVEEILTDIKTILKDKKE